jgi:hypothetical protein
MDKIRDLIAGVKPTPDTQSVAGAVQNMGTYRQYQADMMAQGQQPLPYAQWLAQMSQER